MSKWGGHRHWGADGVLGLGEDQHGRWFAQPDGTRYRRPGAEFVTRGRQVMLVPAADRWFVASFYEPVAGYRWRMYVDICTPATITAGLLSFVDLDLDVVQTFEGEVTVEDEDEFAAHQIELHYPADVVTRAAQECTRVRREAASGADAFAGATVQHWRARWSSKHPSLTR